MKTLYMYRLLKYSAADRELHNRIDFKPVHNLRNVVLCFFVNSVSNLFVLKYVVYIASIYLWFALELSAQLEAETNTTLRDKATETKSEVRTNLLYLYTALDITIIVERDVVIADVDTIVLNCRTIFFNLFTMTLNSILC